VTSDEDRIDNQLPLGPGESLLFGTAGESYGSGWATYFKQQLHPPTAPRFLVRFALCTDESQVYEIVEIHGLATAGAISGRYLRELPLGRMELVVNLPVHRAQMARFAQSRGGDLGITWPGVDLDYMTEVVVGKRRRRRPRMRLDIPEGNRKPDKFYEQVAYRWGVLQAEGAKAAAELAEANDVPVTTVYRWVKEARRRGLMTGGERPRKDTP